MQLISETVGGGIHNIQLTFLGHQLEFDTRLSEIGVVDHSTLFLRYVFAPYRPERQIAQLQRFERGNKGHVVLIPVLHWAMSRLCLITQEPTWREPLYILLLFVCR